MSRLLTVVFSVTVLFSAGFAHAPQHREVRLTQFVQNRVSVIGDSYTTGSDQGGNGPQGWAPQVWKALTEHGIGVLPTVAAEGGAGYCTRGNRGGVYEDLTVRAVKPSDVLVVFFGSRNDMNVEPTRLSIAMYGTFKMARQIARTADLLVIGPPWPTADPPPEIVRVRDVLKYQAELAGGTFFDPIAARWFVGRPELIGRDGVHPTDAGHAYMAEKIAPLISSRLHPF
ncbi:SGNH/GDSL hydrolase family protein [Mycobacterium sp. ITM-2016-00317]|uniref:Rv0518 family GDSL lipase n=1 Tax=Mycobacterium sp. ITM-2016-00317 TaxID=2099694 RepID=UPI000D4B4B20|nr:GDSL lipase [Mycobacterium sp. ITM-2016-00317]WNG85269.1 SGNH/GDSL hydrolase family protein [Mycobacterium sp. ITM-2016-00317]